MALPIIPDDASACILLLYGGHLPALFLSCLQHALSEPFSLQMIILDHFEPSGGDHHVISCCCLLWWWLLAVQMVLFWANVEMYNISSFELLLRCPAYPPLSYYWDVQHILLWATIEMFSISSFELLLRCSAYPLLSRWQSCSYKFHHSVVLINEGLLEVNIIC